MKKLSQTTISQGASPSTSDKEETNFEKDNLKDILTVLKPFNEMLLSEELANPDLFDELFSIDFSDLVKVFYHLLSESDSIEQTYTKMILGAKRNGVQKFAEEVFKQMTIIIERTKYQKKALNPTVRVKSVEVFEHDANSAIYERTG